jgi:hypothetical protein
MSRNKNALIRYKILDKCFRNPGKKYFIEDLIRECEQVLLEIDPQSNGISRRQIFDDIAFMESSEGWNIELDKIRESRRIYYRYSDLSFSINNMPLNEVEIHQLKSALDILTQFKGMPQFEWIHELVPKLQQGIVYETPINWTKNLNQICNSDLFSSSPLSKCSRFLHPGQGYYERPPSHRLYLRSSLTRIPKTAQMGA